MLVLIPALSRFSRRNKDSCAPVARENQTLLTTLSSWLSLSLPIYWSLYMIIITTMITTITRSYHPRKVLPGNVHFAAARPIYQWRNWGSVLGHRPLVLWSYNCAWWCNHSMMVVMVQPTLNFSELQRGHHLNWKLITNLHYHGNIRNIAMVIILLYSSSSSLRTINSFY